MGTITTVEGGFDINPPLKWSQFRDQPVYLEGVKELEQDACGNFCVWFSVRTEEIDTDEGILTAKSAVALRPWSRGMKARDLVKDVQTVLDSFPDHTFTGALWCSGAEFGDLWRVVLERCSETGRTTAYDQIPEITWPGGDTTVPHHAGNMQNPQSPF